MEVIQFTRSTQFGSYIKPFMFKFIEWKDLGVFRMTCKTLNMIYKLKFEISSGLSL